MAFCHSCGSGLVDGAAFCNSCGQRVVVASSTAVKSRSSQSNGGSGGVAVATAVAAPPRVATEQTFFQEGNVLVTNTRLVRGSQMWTMSGVTSVNVHTERPSRFWPIALIIFAVFMLMSALGAQSGAGAICGVVFLVIGILWLRSKKDKHVIVLMNAATSVKAIWSYDPVYIRRIVEAITQAIIHRG